ncbi:glycerol-3-phosphate responsive antiterminator [Caldibacillus lycopersici]|uniref:Glycerol uptake operon antiterminator regulatory protein n=1 Tax=Perspicuibacillus lycopersici TaxID=1325689 RepID=A0AAE3ITW6_9BACI|nr:glycerol-3-phosphate responsive antiterminator [Perspicuibacillus lycopersici]MCU9612704.1 glycerol-3-phosphate responsive antiterminator [Perspicuibacillus lycopersici]
MTYHGQKILPAIRSMKDFEKFLNSPYTYGVLLEVHISRVKGVIEYANRQGKQLFIHVDLIDGLAHNEAATEFICQEFKPYGLISTKGGVIATAKQKGIVATQRAFIIDSNALNKSIHLVKKTEPDIIEVLPGLIPKVITKIKKETGKIIFAGGLIETAEEIELALQYGASAITTSNTQLWDIMK